MTMQPGDHIRARVVDVRDNGIYLEHEGKRALLNVTELSWNEAQPTSPHDFAAKGDALEVLVTAVDDEVFSASLKRLDPGADPWTQASLVVGARHEATVRALPEWGVLVDLDIGLVAVLEGADDRPAPGTRVSVALTVIDRDSRKLRARRVGD